MADRIRPQSYSKLVEDCDNEIRNGRANAVEPLLKNLNFKKIPREFLLPLARICRRTSLFPTGLKILTRAVRPKSKGEAPPTVDETCEYAALLARIGSLREAAGLFKSLNATANPDVLLQTGMCHILSWDYAEAIPAFEQFLKANPEHYSSLTAKVNLAACHVFTNDYPRAFDLIKQITSQANARGAPRLLGNCFELSAQMLAYQNKLSEAKQELNRAAEIFANEKSLDQLFVEKWRAIIASLEAQDPCFLENLRAEIVGRRHWNSLRELDFFRLKIRFEQSVYDRLHFGSPFPAYQRRLQAEFGAEPSAEFLLGDPSAEGLDLRTGRIAGKEVLNPGKKIHRVLDILTRDFYSPVALAVLFAELHGDEFFDIFSSPGRIHQTLYRARGWLEDAGIPIGIEQSYDGYSLKISGAFSLRIERERGVVDTYAKIFNLLERKYPAGQEFTAKQAVTDLGVSRSSLDRVLKQYAAAGLVEQSGTKQIRLKIAR